MALVLAMQEGRSFYVNDTQVRVTKVHSPQRVQLTVVGKAMDHSYEATDRDRVEILPNVYAQIGLGNSVGTVKVVLEAPREDKILRDALYHGEEG